MDEGKLTIDFDDSWDSDDIIITVSNDETKYW